MNIIVQNLLKDIKSKSPTDWKKSDLEDFAYAIQYIYKYLDTLEDSQTLRLIYDRIVGIINNDKNFHTMIDPGFLIKIDKNK